MFYLFLFGVYGTFYGANWEESHTHILNCTQKFPILGFTCGITESYWYLIGTLWANAYTHNRFSNITLGELFPNINDSAF